MPLPSGTRIGSYEIVGPLGAGGMGEVYRARDTRLSRDVAIKVLPEVFALDADRLARFEREAKALAALNHPNIAAIYGIESNALVMELVEGDDLSTQVLRGPMIVADALHIAKQIVDALEAAHEAGIVHRDLKPGNIKVRADGTVKVLDFGLAKATGPDSASEASDLMNSPTLTARATQLGVILGTAAYMAPEQAKGKAVDKRADIWAFGVVLFEMLTGDRAFKGEDISETLASVLTREPNLAALPAGTPRALHRLIGRCLTRDPRLRLRDIGDARFDLAEAERGPDIATPTVAPARTSRALVAGLATVALLASVSTGWLLLRPGDTPSSPPVHLSIALPEGHSLVSGPAISRDGRRVAFVSTDGVGRPQLYVRDLDGTEARLIKGTEEADGPFFSPNGDWIAFYARNGLFKVNVDGSAPVPLAQSTSNAGGTWTESGTIIFKKTWNGGLDVVGENGGEAKPFIAPDRPDEYAYVWPYAIPGGRELLFASWGKTFETVLLDTSSMTKRVVGPGWWRRFAYIPAGYLVGADDGELRALKVAAAGKAAGEAMTVVKDVDAGSMDGDARSDVSQNGTLVYMASTPGQRSLVAVDHQGKVSALPAPVGDVNSLRVASDGRRAAVVVRGRLGILDLVSGTRTPLVPDLDAAGGARGSPVWSHGGQSVTFASNHEGSWEIYSKSASGAGELVSVLKQPLDQYPESYAPDGTLLFKTTGPLTGTDLWLLPHGGQPKAWVATGAEEYEGRFSPDGRTIAYISNASGRDEVYIQSLDSATDRFQVSAAGGADAVWSLKGDRLYFRQGNVMMQAAVNTTGRLSSNAPVQLFNGGWTLSQSFDLMPDDQHFLMVQQPREAVPTRIDIVLNWFTTLNERVGRSR
ncbi:MAG: protein kinase [Vicinamibacterales bacterium]